VAVKHQAARLLWKDFHFFGIIPIRCVLALSLAFWSSVLEPEHGDVLRRELTRTPADGCAGRTPAGQQLETYPTNVKKWWPKCVIGPACSL
jgi:hypothetical protein